MKSRPSRFGWAAGLSALALIGVSAWAGSLEPPGPPAPTMKTLDEIPPAWSRILPAAERFVLVMGDAAVLDKETGLVWEQSPSTDFFDWTLAQLHCNERIVANRMGWRLPTLQELTSMADPANGGLPPGHPFSNVSLVGLWSATSRANNPDAAWHVTFIFPGNLGTGSLKINDSFTWCVRGGQGPDAQ